MSALKTAMVCPFSKCVCKECAVYRGRHAAICFAGGYHPGSLWPEMEERQKPANGAIQFRMEALDIPDCSTRLKDVEDFGC